MNGALLTQERTMQPPFPYSLWKLGGLSQGAPVCVKQKSPNWCILRSMTMNGSHCLPSAPPTPCVCFTDCLGPSDNLKLQWRIAMSGLYLTIGVFFTFLSALFPHPPHNISLSSAGKLLGEVFLENQHTGFLIYYCVQSKRRMIGFHP